MSGTVLAGVLSVSLLSVDRDKGETPTAAIAVGTIALAAAISAIYGTHQVNRCRRARATDLVDAPPSQILDKDRVFPGTQGGPCNEDGSCNEDLRCDAPMQVCIPDDPSEFN